MLPERKSVAGESSPDEPADEQKILKEIEVLEAEAEDFERKMAEADQAVIDLRNDEDIPAGRFHAKEIFERQQERLALETERLFRINKTKRLRLRLMDLADSGQF